MNDALGKRIKGNYESISKTKLVRRMPVIIRIDGKAFHSYCRHFQKPFDPCLMEAMHETTRYLCQNIQGCVLGYTQSDEISLLLIDYKHINSSAWFDNEVQKICSVSASMATAFFNYKIKELLMAIPDDEFNNLYNQVSVAYQKVCDGKLAMFDARCFNIPKEEVTNYFYWRQVDAIRNSVQMVAHVYFSHKFLQNKSTAEIKQRILDEFGIEFNTDYKLKEQRGVTCVKSSTRYLWDTKGKGSIDSSHDEWIIDDAIPIFKGDGREYIEPLLLPCVD